MQRETKEKERETCREKQKENVELLLYCGFFIISIFFDMLLFVRDMFCSMKVFLVRRRKSK